MRGSSTPPIEHLLAHSSWVQELARRLVQDPYLAEDLAQATYMAAIEKPPADALRRGWLATVMRNVLRQHRRRERERMRREVRAARPEAMPSTASMVERVQVQRQVVEAVLSLDEHYRSVVLWRFFEEMSPGEIAKRRGVPVATIHSQLGRALQQLRGRLESARPGGRRALLSALIPLARHASPRASAPMLGALLMKTKILSAAAVLIGTAVVAWALWPQPSEPIPPVGAASSTPEPETAQIGMGDEAVTERRSLAPEPTSEPATDRVTEAAVSFRGRVFDVLGRPVPGVTVGTQPESTTASTDAAGVFQLTLPPGSGQLHVVEDAWVTLVAGLVPDASSAEPIEPVLVAAPTLVLEGRVTDRTGEPIAGADVRSRIPDFAARIPYSLDATQPLYRRWNSNTDSDGRFRLPAIGSVPGATLSARKIHYMPTEVDQPASSRNDIHLVLERPEPEGEVVLGQVLDPFSNPVGGAYVALGRSSTITEEGGFFRLTRARAAGSRRVTAMSRGYLPGEAEFPEVAQGAPPPFVYVYLGEEPLWIRGRVVEPDGSPVAGARVWPVDLQLVPGINGSVEGYLSGGPTDTELAERFTRDGRLIASMSDLKERNPSAAWSWVVTAADGSFELQGLQDRNYTLRVLVESGLQIADSGPYPAGSDGVRIVYEPEIHPVVSGRVVGRDGQPIPGVTVEVNRWATYTETSLPDGSIYSTGDAIPGPKVRTDSQGRFRVENIGRGGLWFTVLGDDIMNQNFGLLEHGLENVTTRPFDDLQLEVERRLHIRVQLGLPDIADRFRILDESGEPMPIVNFEGGGRTSSGSWPIEGGRTRVYAVSEAARSLALLKGGQEVERLSITLQPGIVNVIGR